MENLYILYITLAGSLGTGFGGILSLILPTKSKKFFCMVLELSAGLMTTVIFFDLLPNAMEKAKIFDVIFGFLTGIFFMIITECLTESKSNSLIRMGSFMAIGIALHNFPEGLALGVAFDFDLSLAWSLLIAIFVHDIPEGLAFALPLKMGGMKKAKIVAISIITGLATGFGGIFGMILGEISNNTIGFSLALASGAMFYIVFNSILPKSKTLCCSKMTFFANIVGIIVGILISHNI